MPLTRQQELDVIRQFEETIGVTQLGPVDSVDRAIALHRGERQKRSRDRNGRETQRLKSWKTTRAATLKRDGGRGYPD